MRAPKQFIAQQRGIALVIALIFLLILTIFGVTAMSTTALEEKMAGNTKERNVAFQSAESALRLAEDWVSAQLTMPTFPNKGNGLWSISTTGVPSWDQVNWAATGSPEYVAYPGTPGTTVSSGLLYGVKTQPKYIVEELGEIPEKGGSAVAGTGYGGAGGGKLKVYRITARGTGGNDFAQVMLQSTFARH